MKRREFLGLVGGVAAAAWPVVARGQQVPRVPVIGFLHPGFPELTIPVFEAMREGLRDFGYVEGKTVKFEGRRARGKPERLAQLGKELVQLRVDILIAIARPAVEAARETTSSLPIVASDLESDPVASKDSFAPSDLDGDGYGYDVQSFETNGQQRLLEIKTTCGNERTPFWMTKRECDVAAEKGDIYRVRRVFHFRNEVKMFDIPPPLEARLLLTPATFMAAPR
jgi:Domain of unknown function (DUF3883)/ABC transporter substrate binding protein